MEKEFSTTAVIQINDELIQDWLDSFCPSAKTFATNFVVNLVPRYGYDYLEEEGYGEILSVINEHFIAYLQLKVAETHPGYSMTGLCVPRD